MVEQSAVNRKVAGSNPASGAIFVSSQNLPENVKLVFISLRAN
jgi:hypothetical protein